MMVNYKKYLIILAFLLLMYNVIALGLTEEQLEGWTQAIYQHCKDFKYLIADCNKVGEEFECRYQTEEISEENIKKFLIEIDREYGRDLGQAPGKLLLGCYTTKYKGHELARDYDYFLDDGKRLYDFVPKTIINPTIKEEHNFIKFVINNPQIAIFSFSIIGISIPIIIILRRKRKESKGRQKKKW